MVTAAARVMPATHRELLGGPPSRGPRPKAPPPPSKSAPLGLPVEWPGGRARSRTGTVETGSERKKCSMDS